MHEPNCAGQRKRCAMKSKGPTRQVSGLNYKKVVTSFLTAEQQILLLRRSAMVGTHRGQWSGVSGYLEGDERPLTRAITEIREELGLPVESIELVRAGETLRAFDEGTDTVWIIHPFLFQSKSRVLKLDWENAEYRWVNPQELTSYDTVPKLRETLDRVRYDLGTEPPLLANVLRKVRELETDRVHGAAFLGRRAVELLSETAQASDATDSDTLFSHLLITASKMRRGQPAMANVWNLPRKLLHIIDVEKNGISVQQLKNLVREHSMKIIEQSAEAVEEVARTSTMLLSPEGSLLTHSYSSTVYRSLELGFKGRSVSKVYVTESYPGMEGKQFANDLVALGVPVTLIADSAVTSVIREVSLVLVGADSVLRDGSLVHKTGTRNIALAAKRHGVPMYSLSEISKLSVQDFLGERPDLSELFDVTPAEFVSSYITEEGELAPEKAERRLRELQKEVYS